MTMRIDISALPNASGITSSVSARAQEAMKETMAMLFQNSTLGMVEDVENTQQSMDLDEVALRLQEAFRRKDTNAHKSTSDHTTFVSGALDDCFKSCNRQASEEDRLAEFRLTEVFILQEQDARRVRQAESRRMEASEEKRLAAEVAQLKGLRLQSQRNNGNEDLRWKITHAERSYTSRKMVYAKAAQVAGAELRLQFARVRSFLQDLHKEKLKVLHQQHHRTLQFQALLHTIQKTDSRVVSLDKQITMRLFRKKKADLNEFHAARTLEEAVFLEGMMDGLDQVQTAKETAARELFDLHVKNLKEERNTRDRQQDELELFAASATLEMAKLVAQYTEAHGDETEMEHQAQEKVESIERGKNFDAINGGKGDKYLSTTKLYDTILWSVASNDLGLTSSGSSLYSSDFGSDIFVDEEDADKENSMISDPMMDSYEDDDDNEANADAVYSNDSPHKEKCLTPIGTIHSRQLAKELRAREKALLRKHAKEIRAERIRYQKLANELKAKHQASIDGIIEAGLAERQALQEAIDEKMADLARQQKESTDAMRKNDLELMKNALMAEDQRVEEAEVNSFRRAQEFISAQVFHEVRNALSAVIAMSEMTDTLKTDSSLTPKELVGSVDDMLDQIGDVVNYALKMLNEILDVSKINSGAFTAKKEAFDLQDVVARATRMQQAKASKIKMAFEPLSKPCIALSDSGIVERIVATMISNAVKFTPLGAVQPFIWPLDAIQAAPPAATSQNHHTVSGNDSASTASNTSETTSSSSEMDESRKLLIENTKMKMYAVGVADTGSGLTIEKLNEAKLMIGTSTSNTSTNGAQNTGFGLYHAHLQAKALNSHIAISTLGECRSMLNQDMLGAVQEIRDATPAIKNALPGPGTGTVLYITIPVYEDCDGAQAELKKNSKRIEAAKRLGNTCEYSFRPLPSPLSTDGSFRILVADDVLMLRKGLVHTISKLFAQKFPHCPVSVCTACTAEDMLRAVDAEAFDLIICDHHFNHDESRVQSIVPGDSVGNQRPCLRFDESNSSQEATRGDIREFFKKERFTTEKEDGKLLGFDALVHLATATALRNPVPLLMLVSGHKIEAEPKLGIVVVQKPLKSHEFITKLEQQAANLVVSKRCTDQSDGASGRTILVGSQGGQLFVHQDSQHRKRMKTEVCDGTTDGLD